MMDPRQIRDAAIANGVFDTSSDFYRRNWPDVTLRAIDLFAPYEAQIRGAAKNKRLVLTINAPPYRVYLNAGNHVARIAPGFELAPWELRFVRDGNPVASIDFLAGPDGVLAVGVEKGFSDIQKREKAREIEDHIIECCDAEIARRAG